MTEPIDLGAERVKRGLPSAPDFVVQTVKFSDVLFAAGMQRQGIKHAMYEAMAELDAKGGLPSEPLVRQNGRELYVREFGETAYRAFCEIMDGYLAQQGAKPENSRSRPARLTREQIKQKLRVALDAMDTKRGIDPEDHAA